MRNTRLDLPLGTERMSNAAVPVAPVGMFKISNPKRFWITAAVFVALLLSLTLLLAAPRHPDILYNEPPSDYTIEHIRYKFTSKSTNYPGKFVRWNYVDPYYGTINGCIIMIAHPFGESSAEPWQQTIAGYSFEWDSPIDLFVYQPTSTYSGDLCTLQEAYQKGWLTEKQIGKIHKRHLEYREEFPQLLAQWEKDRENDQTT